MTKKNSELKKKFQIENLLKEIISEEKKMLKN